MTEGQRRLNSAWTIGIGPSPLGPYFVRRWVRQFTSTGRHRSAGKMARSDNGTLPHAGTTRLSSNTREAVLKADSGTRPHDRSFRPDVQGLRAIAVTLVVLYHVGVPGVGGGFVGVDVFFVISGYVITSLLLRERLKSGRTSLRNFYARRARRILPAATLVIVGTTIGSFYYLGFIAGGQVASDASAAALFVSNFHFMHLGTDYASAQVPPSPLQNFWSLAVEEQFYLVYPAILTIFAKVMQRVRFEFKLSAILSLIVVASFTWSIVQTKSNPAAAYFSPFTRAWELAIGALVAIMSPYIRYLHRWHVAASFTWLGMGAVLFSAVKFSNNTSFPGFAAAVPVMGTAIVIFAGTAVPRFGAESLLSLKPLQWVGTISYGLYLTHWPILVISAEHSSSKLSVGYNLLLAVLALGVCAVIYLVLEKPIRHARFLASRPVFSIGLVPLCIGISLAVVAFEQYRYYLPIHLI
jgi:peptidoglycan/LPS O-acetylase OafA/YrhL